MKHISPTNDLAFKKVLASEENKDILRGFIFDFFGLVPEEIIIENPYSIKEYKEIIEGNDVNTLRYTSRDITASIVTADFVSELQIRKSSFFDERSLYYPFERYCQNYNRPGKMELNPDGRPNRYSSLKPVYALNILGYTHFRDSDALRIFELYDPIRQKSMNKELIKIGFFELTKDVIETPNQVHWRNYFTRGEVSSNAPEYLKKATDVIKYVNLGKEEQDVAKVLEKAIALYDEGLVDSFHEGKAEGKVEGIAEGKTEGITIGKTEVAIKLLRKGLPIELIAEYTDLSPDEIESLKLK